MMPGMSATTNVRASRQLHDAEVGRQRRERIVRDLGTRGRDHRQQRRLAGVRLADEPDVGDELELELQRALLAFLARLPFARRLMRGRGEERVALSASTAARDDDLVAVREHLAERSAPPTSRMMVPGGTGRTTSSPERPVLFEPMPCSPRSAVQLSRYV